MGPFLIKNYHPVYHILAATFFAGQSAQIEMQKDIIKRNPIPKIMLMKAIQRKISRGRARGGQESLTDHTVLHGER